jgi:Zn-dependent M28 family amino/carboxypeptidase
MKACFIIVASLIYSCLHAQQGLDIVSIDSLKTHLNFLAGDNLKGRGPYSKGLEKSAALIYQCFARAGLKSFPGYKSYYQAFAANDPEKPVMDSNGYHFDNSLFNVIGILDGKTRPTEAIIISAHYDHVPSDMNLYNGANDNASGVAALLSLVDYYAKTGNNARTIIFCAFSGEELGLVGSTAFAKIIDEEQIVAMINMDMVGVPGFGKNKFCITGADHSNMKKILKKNLQNSPYKIVPEPDGKSLFLRSDNFPFAKLGIPAHTIMTGDDSYNCYHMPCDDVNRIDFTNLGEIVKAIFAGISTIISGGDKPSRIDKEKLSGLLDD